ncbi:four-carbon acid sugar kinase family protein [Alicyclobacillus fodiniaquatilis]|uniref:Four-carbon acid sugar kinase family protein n=1 Tax=Alicyclobacillus fodiniaquatilis TaxID=1661150 RepID=A0ABW4JKU6_9BACL
MNIGVVADDITGANDIGIMFAKHNLTANVYSLGAGDQLLSQGMRLPAMAVIDTNSRLDSPADAYAKVRQATAKLRSVGYQQFFNKTCSVFRGNIGAEFDAMLDELDAEFAVVVLGFPKNGRTTVDGIHYVAGQKLEDSAFRHDPIHPMRRSDLVGILQSQTKRKVALITHQVIDQGEVALRGQIEQMRAKCNYLILDVVDQASLGVIAKAVAKERIICGSSAIAEELAALATTESPLDVHMTLPVQNGYGICCVAGSLTPQTKAQVAYMKAQGTPTIELETTILFDETARHSEIDRLTGDFVQHLKARRNPILHASHSIQAFEATMEAGARRGMTSEAVGRLVADTLSQIVQETRAQLPGLNRFVILGGETSAAICKQLDVHAMAVWREIEPGLPSCISLTEPPFFLILKSGSFGQADFIKKAIDHLSESA